MDGYEIHVSPSAGDVIKTREGIYYRVHRGVARGVAARHVDEIKRRFPVPVFPTADHSVKTDSLVQLTLADNGDASPVE